MLSMRLDPAAPLRILCLGAHCDDIEIGCGATLARLVAQYPDAEVSWVVLTSTPERETETRAAARVVLGEAASSIDVHRFRDGFLPMAAAEVKEVFEALKPRMAPDLILTHHGADAHQDHRLVAELTWNTFRDHAIWEYEIPKYDGDLGKPNLYVRLDEAACAQKVEMLLNSFPSQRNRRWFDEDTFRAVMRLRGMECNAPGRYAEAFHVRKLVL